MAYFSCRSLGYKDFEKLMNHVYSNNLNVAQIKDIFNRLDSTCKGKFVSCCLIQNLNDFLNLTDILNSDPSLIYFEWEFKWWGRFKFHSNNIFKFKKII